MHYYLENFYKDLHSQTTRYYVDYDVFIENPFVYITQHTLEICLYNHPHINSIYNIYGDFCEKNNIITVDIHFFIQYNVIKKYEKHLNILLRTEKIAQLNERILRENIQGII